MKLWNLFIIGSAVRPRLCKANGLRYDHSFRSTNLRCAVEVELDWMPAHFEFDPENKILLLVVEGDVGDSEILTANGRIARHVEHLKPSAGITDLSAVTRFAASGDAMQTAARQPRPYPQETRWFIVAPKDEVFGMARMYELVGSETRPNLKVVRSREVALQALGALNPDFELVSHIPKR